MFILQIHLSSQITVFCLNIVELFLQNWHTMQVAGLAVTSVVCFTSSALVALLTDIPVSG